MQRREKRRSHNHRFELMLAMSYVFLAAPQIIARIDASNTSSRFEYAQVLRGRSLVALRDSSVCCRATLWRTERHLSHRSGLRGGTRNPFWLNW